MSLRYDEQFQAALKAYKDVLYRYAASGVCDTEGRTAVWWWMQKKLYHRQPKRLSFSDLEGYTSYRPNDLTKPERDRLPYTKTQIAADINKALVPLVRAMKRAIAYNQVDVKDVLSWLP